jgi:hypothetical protein
MLCRFESAVAEKDAPAFWPLFNGQKAGLFAVLNGN